MLLKTLQAVIIVFSYASGPDGKIKRGRWALELKSSLENLVQNMEQWQRRFSEYIALLRQTGYGSAADGAFRPSSSERLRQRLTSAMTEGWSNTGDLYLQSLPVGEQDLENVPHSMLKMPKAHIARRDYVVESRHYERNDDPEYVKSVVSHTAEILSACDPRTTHVLCCEGYTRPANLMRFEIMLKFPPGMGSPRTLRDLLLDPDFPAPSVNTRFTLCRQIAEAALYFHAADLVHKSIRPENILLLQEKPMTATVTDAPQVGSPFLVGLENVRMETHDWQSSLRVNNRWERDLYSHPSRQGRPTAKYTMAHDVYSIGVVLFEIGLWRCFLKWDVRDYTIDETVLPGGQNILQRMRELQPGAREELQSLYTSLASQDLPIVMGDKFTHIVLSCLSAVEDGLDPEGTAEGANERGENDEILREEAERVGLSYIDTVLANFDTVWI
jgi:hypothetical protein